MGAERFEENKSLFFSFEIRLPRQLYSSLFLHAACGVLEPKYTSSGRHILILFDNSDENLLANFPIWSTSIINSLNFTTGIFIFSISA